MTTSWSTPSVTEASTELFYIVDLRAAWFRLPYITLWRPDNQGYAYPLPWAGRYTREQVRTYPNQYTELSDGSLVRFPVPCEVARRYGVAPKPRMVDGDVGPVLPNSVIVRAALKAARLQPALENVAR